MNVFRFFTLLMLISVCDAQEQISKSILFISDTQQPLWIETFRLKEHNNEIATRKIFSAMAQESSAVALFHLGDITAIGMNVDYWRSFDSLRAMLHIPIYPAFGNHEYFYIPALGKEQTIKRFPFLELSWYLRRIGSVAVIMLNSNFSNLSAEEMTGQDTWYRNQLSKLENDSTVNAIIVGCHHSPLTNSSIIKSNAEVQYRFVEPFKRSVKTKLFISGHAHTYERFRFDGKDFLVIGGGGGLLHPLKEEHERTWNDISSKESNRRFFHYAKCELRRNELLIQVKMLKEDFSGFESVDEIIIPL